MASKKNDQKTYEPASPKYWVGLILTHLLIPLVLIICAWDLCWWQSWLYAVLIVVTGVGSRILSEKRHPGLMVERAKFSKTEGVKSWDKVLAPLMAISTTFPLVIVAGLDHRFDWSPLFPMWLNVVGFILIILGYTFAAWALVVNRFFSSVMRIQTDRGHTVCDSGPYKIVRHPGYAGNILALPGLVLALSSVWTIIPVIVATIISVIRTKLEDDALQEELPGYQNYVSRVRYRLVPGVF